MKNADLPAMPFVEPDTACSVCTGLTKREMFAMHFHAALLATESLGTLPCYIAVREADALLAELDKKAVI